MGKIFALIGRSGTGKSTIEKELERLGYERIISNTTRPIRENEQQGIDYHYLTEEEFKKLQDNDELIEHTTFRNWNYGVAKKDISKLDTQNYIAVVNPHGYVQMKEKLGNKIIPILIYCTPYERISRLISREPNGDEKVFREICRRYISDSDTFAEFEDKKLYRYKVHNNNLKQAVDIINNIIDEESIELPIKVKITKINNPEGAEHLIQYIGKEGLAFSWIKQNELTERKYKVLLDEENDLTAYFLRSELEIVK